MRIVTHDDTQTRRDLGEWFSSSVWMEASPTGPSPDAGVFRVFFEPEARTANSGGGTDWLEPATD